MVIRLQGSHAVIAAALAALLLGSVSQCALAQTAKDPAIELPTVTVQGSKKAPVKKSAPTKQTAAEPIASGAALDTTLENKTTVTLDAAPDVGKTGTKLGDLPQSVVVVPKGLVGEQGGTSLRAATRDVSSVNEGGPSSYGFFDRFMIRGMDARIYSDSFPDGDQSNGFPHSLNGVDHIEVLKGPGSALLGSTTPGGSINIVHAVPSSTFGYGTGLQIGSFGTVSNSFYVTGPGSVPGLTYRIDGLLEHADRLS
jgi:iron complex outermembrane recepter protein